MSAIEVQSLTGRARDFLKGMDLLQYDLVEYRCSSALLGIHCAISYSDALRNGLGTSRLTSDDHRTAAGELRSLLVSRRFGELQGVDRLEKLLSRKNRIAYSAASIREDEVEDIVKQAQRFARWAEETGRQLEIGGW